MKCEDLLDTVRESDLLSFIYDMIFAVFYVIGYLLTATDAEPPILVD
jgi:hypothetical protein